MSGGNNQIMSNFINKERISMNVNREVGEFRVIIYTHMETKEKINLKKGGKKV